MEKTQMNPRMNSNMMLKLAIHVSVAALIGISASALADSASVGAAISDTAITAKVKAKFADDTRLKTSNISVTTNNGVVALTGSAPSSDAKSAAEQLAKTVDGVASVDDEIASPSLADEAATKTKHAAHATGKVASDSWITTKVKSALLADSVTKGVDISVSTTSGVVTLSGTLASSDQVAHAVATAKKIKGVKSVESDDLKATG
jgi:hyperosmotically inducible protein